MSATTTNAKAKTLRQQLDEFDSAFRETGHLYGLKELELTEGDPGKFNRLQWRIVQGCLAARDTAKYVSASPQAATMAELSHMLALPDGNVVACSFGLTGHIGCNPIVVRSMIELGFEDNPGIRDGDIFDCNDPLYGPPHNADNFTLLPIFHDGELIAWATGLNHVSDVGSAITGAMPVLSPSTYTDGWILPPTKVGENFTTHKWYELMLNRRTRLGMFNVFDHKMRLTGCLMLRQRLLDVIQEFGRDYVLRALREILERERRSIQETIRTQMVPGTYVQSEFRTILQKGAAGKVFPQADRDWLVHSTQEVKITPDCRIVIDYAGTSSEGNHAFNAYEGQSRWATYPIGLPLVVQSVTVNTAFDTLCELKIPKGTALNAARQDVSTVCAVIIGTEPVGGIMQAISQSYAARGFLEEAWIWDNVAEVYQVEGVFDNGTPWAINNFTLAGSIPRGPMAFRDGEPNMLGWGNPQADHGEVEDWEFLEPPLITIGRGLLPDYCGHGRQRGAVGGSLVHLVYKPGQHCIINCTGRGNTMGGSFEGSGGGYPGPAKLVTILHNTNAHDLVRQGKALPRNIVEARRMLDEGTLTAQTVETFGGQVMPTTIEDGDLIIQTHQAGSGWGDPIERDPKLAEDDLNAGWISPDVARTVYGIVASRNDDAWEVDVQASEEARRQIREQRRQRAMSAEEWWRQEREWLMAKDLAELSRDMFRDLLTMEHAAKFSESFRQFWQLPEGYSL